MRSEGQMLQDYISTIFYIVVLKPLQVHNWGLDILLLLYEVLPGMYVHLFKFHICKSTFVHELWYNFWLISLVCLVHICYVVPLLEEIIVKTWVFQADIYAICLWFPHGVHGKSNSLSNLAHIWLRKLAYLPKNDSHRQVSVATCGVSSS
jgi:hypothetical protein